MKPDAASTGGPRRGRGKKPRGAVVDGMLLLDKPAGLSSNQALQQAKRLLNARKAGHTGSLDPIATGLLPLCFGETTKIAGLFLDAGKSYRVEIRLGMTTDTGDKEGQACGETCDSVDFTRAQLDKALDKFRGNFEQIPPMYSALKQKGQPLYKLARKGVTVERAPRAVTVYELRVEKWEGLTLELTLSCSRGFYVRTLATDLGEALGCGAHVRELRRTGLGGLGLDKGRTGFSIDDAFTLAQIETVTSPMERRKFLLPTERALAHLPEIKLPDNLAYYLSQGRSVRPPGAGSAPVSESGLVRVYSDTTGFLGLGEISADGKVTPRRMFHAP